MKIKKVLIRELGPFFSNGVSWFKRNLFSVYCSMLSRTQPSDFTPVFDKLIHNNNIIIISILYYYEYKWISFSN